MRRRITQRPSKAGGIMGVVAGGLFTLVGIFMVIPTFGLFGIIWTLFAAGFAVISGYQAFGKPSTVQEYFSTELEVSDPDGAAPEGGETPRGSAEARLTELRELYDQRLITAEEYEQKRKEIIREL